MSDKSAIEWLKGGATWNVLGGCSKCSPGCQGCYAERMTHRLAHNPATPQYAGLTGAQGRWTGEIRLFPGKSQEPRKWKKPRRVFVQSMGDLFHEKVPVGWITHVLDTIQACPQHTFIMLTKRPENMRKALYGVWDQGRGHTWQYQEESHVIPNLWLGVTTCTPDEKWKIDRLRDIPAAVRFLSLEPLLGDMGALDLTGISWVIVGGETGPGARPMHPYWASSVKNQCRDAGVPFFFKGWGAYEHLRYYGGDDQVREDALSKPHQLLTSDGVLWTAKNAQPPPGTYIIKRSRKKDELRLLDGQVWEQFPEVK